MEWINGQKPHLIKNGVRIQCDTENFVPIVIPGLSTSSSSSLPSSTHLQGRKLIIPNLLQARQPQHPRLLQVRKLIIQITIPQSCQGKVWIDKHGETRTFLKYQKSCYMNQPKSQNQIKLRITNRYGEARIPTYQNGCKNSERILLRKEFLNTETHTPVLLMNHL